ncbi:MAG TPA: helix-turn-helix domain-containing protein [Candidatus Ruminococcus avistercoris]|nr:helix-turn-helix domain-containing protein [Candidatus Ruminococcus avistercoris]
MREKDKRELSRSIRLSRKDRGMTQEQLARELDVDRTYICAIENGRRRPSLRLMIRLSEILEIDLLTLILDR